MSVNPLDLQTLFSHIDIATRNYTHQKDAAVHAQGIIGRHVVEKSIHHEHAVNHVEELPEESLTIKDNEESEQKEYDRQDNKQKESEPDKSHHYSNSDDPMYGSRVDLSG